MKNNPISDLPASAVPLATIVATALDSANIPANWLLCDGSQVNSNTFPQLAALMKTVPNLCGQVVVGSGKSPVSGNTYTPGQQHGEETHALLAAEMPAHNHAFTLPKGDQNWQGSTVGDTVWGTNADFGFNTLNAGGDVNGNVVPHNNMQPYFVLNYIIYAGQAN